MISQEFEFHSPSTVSEAVELLAANAEDGKVLAGGMSLVPAMNLGIAHQRSDRVRIVDSQKPYESAAGEILSAAHELIRLRCP